MKAHHPLGIDIGGSGIKGAPVDLETGRFAADRLRIETPQKSTPEAVAEVVGRIADHFAKKSGDSPVGVTVPAVVARGLVRTAANIDPSWVGSDAAAVLTATLGRPVTVVNDADAAGVGELHYGAARSTPGLVVLATLGTGIGSALLNNGELIPSSELGHLLIDGVDAEKRASSHARGARTCRGNSGPTACRRTSPTWRTCSGRTSSWSAAASPSTRTATCPCCTCAPRSSPRSWATPPVSSAPPGWRRTRTPEPCAALFVTLPGRLLARNLRATPSRSCGWPTTPRNGTTMWWSEPAARAPSSPRACPRTPRSRSCCWRPAVRTTRTRSSIPAAFSRSVQDTVGLELHHDRAAASLAAEARYWPRMKALGGSSSMNAMIYIRGNRADYDAWRDVHGAAGWGWDDVLRLLHQVRGQHPPRVADCTDRMVRCTSRTAATPDCLTQTWVESAVASGLKPTDDFNGTEQEGAGLLPGDVQERPPLVRRRRLPASCTRTAPT
ncbi:MAG: ROK family protein [Nocardioidaceae bacterium]